MPVVEEEKQNTPTFSSEVMTGLASWKKERERMIFVLCGAGGFRVGEVLGIEIDKHISPDFLTISVEQKVHHGRVEQRLKTANGLRQVDLHPAIAALLKEFVGDRTTGFLFCTENGKPLSATNIIRRHLHPALKQLNYVNPFREHIRLGTMRSVVSGTRTCGTRPSAQMGFGNTGWVLREMK